MELEKKMSLDCKRLLLLFLSSSLLFSFLEFCCYCGPLSLISLCFAQLLGNLIISNHAVTFDLNVIVLCVKSCFNVFSGTATLAALPTLVFLSVSGFAAQAALPLKRRCRSSGVAAQVVLPLGVPQQLCHFSTVDRASESKMVVVSQTCIFLAEGAGLHSKTIYPFLPGKKP